MQARILIFRNWEQPIALAFRDTNNSYSLCMKMAPTSYFALMRMVPGTRSCSRTASMKLPHLAADQSPDTRLRDIHPKIVPQGGRRKVLTFMLMLLLLVGFYGLFAGLVSFSENVIEPEQTS